MKFTPQYSGRRSYKIWDKINKVKNGHWLYTAFVLLQEMESRCLSWLNNKEQTEKGER